MDTLTTSEIQLLVYALHDRENMWYNRATTAPTADRKVYCEIEQEEARSLRKKLEKRLPS